jgi:hypothetical protein
MKIFGKTDTVISVKRPFQKTRKDEYYSGEPNSFSAYKEHLSTSELSAVRSMWLFLGAAKWPVIIFTP